MSDPFPRLATVSSPKDLFTGLMLPVRAIKLIFTTKRLFGLSALGGFITLCSLLALAPFWWPRAQRIAGWLIGSGETWQRSTSGVIGLLIFLLLYAVSALTLPNLLLAPLQDPLSEATEARCGGFLPSPFTVRAFVRGIAESLAHTVLRLFFMALGFGVLWPLNFIPGAGSVLWLGLSSVWTMFWLAVEHLSNPAARHLHSFGQVFSALKARLWLAMGFGAAVWVLLWVPLVNFFLLPVAVVASTLLFRSLRQTGVFGPPPEGTNGR